MHHLRRHLATAATLGLLATTAAPLSAQGSDPETVEGHSEVTYADQVIEQYRIATDHGTIYGEVVRPVVPDDVLVPVILTYSPYNILGSPSNDTGSIADDSVASYYVPRGYARAVFDVVGTRESSGCYDYGGIRERETARDVINALGEFAWSNGKVGMIGGSYDGTTQLAAAIEAPEHLVTIVPQVAIDRWYDYAYGNGIRYYLNEENPSDEGFDTPLAFDFGFGFIPPTDVTDEGYGQAFQDRVNPCERDEHTEKAYIPDPVYDEFWDERDYRAAADKVTASVFIEGGWLDHNVKHWNSTRFFEALPADHPKKLVMGQWGHSGNRFQDATQIRHAWFDHWLLGLDTGIMDIPAVDSAYGMHDGSSSAPLNVANACDSDTELCRVQSDTWPPEGTIVASIPLAAAAGDGPTLVGAGSSWTDANKLLTETAVLDGGCANACLLFATEPFAEDVRINGSPTLAATVSSSAAETHFTPFLFDEDPAGNRAIITRGFLNARNRETLRESTTLTPGAPYEANIEFWDVDWRLQAGHRLGLAVMSTNSVWALSDQSAATNTLDLTATSLKLPVSWGASQFSAAAPPVEPAPTPAPEPTTQPEPAPETEPANEPLPATGGGLAVLSLAALATARRLRRA